jgi:hypothetical protein
MFAKHGGDADRDVAAVINTIAADGPDPKSIGVRRHQYWLARPRILGHGCHELRHQIARSTRPRPMRATISLSCVPGRRCKAHGATNSGHV